MINNFFLTLVIVFFCPADESCPQGSNCQPEPIYLEENTKSVPTSKNMQKQAFGRKTQTALKQEPRVAVPPQNSSSTINGAPQPPVLEASDPRNDPLRQLPRN